MQAIFHVYYHAWQPLIEMPHLALLMANDQVHEIPRNFGLHARFIKTAIAKGETRLTFLQSGKASASTAQRGKESIMNIRKSIYIGSIGLFLAALTFGCAGLNKYGKLRVQSEPGQRTTLEELKKNWREFSIYRAGLYAAMPSALLFDPKDDDKTVVGEGWAKVEDEKTLSALMSSIQSSSYSFPMLQRILGPDDQFYGYFFSPWSHAYIKVIDEKTLWIEDIPLTPELASTDGGSDE
jgi:hypothetical protein